MNWIGRYCGMFVSIVSRQQQSAAWFIPSGLERDASTMADSSPSWMLALALSTKISSPTPLRKFHCVSRHTELAHLQPHLDSTSTVRPSIAACSMST